MKTLTIAAWKWILVAGALAVVGLLLATGAGRKRGTCTYRWRVSLWAFVLVMLGGSSFAVTGCDTKEEKNADVTAADTSRRGEADLTTPPTCYLVGLPDAAADVEPGPDVPVMCYEPVIDVVQPPEDIPVLCYAPLLPDTVDQGDTTVQQDTVKEDPDVLIMCYDPMPEDIQFGDEDLKEFKDVPVPTCYAPPPPQE